MGIFGRIFGRSTINTAKLDAALTAWVTNATKVGVNTAKINGVTAAIKNAARVAGVGLNTTVPVAGAGGLNLNAAYRMLSEKLNAANKSGLEKIIQNAKAAANKSAGNQSNSTANKRESVTRQIAKANAFFKASNSLSEKLTEFLTLVSKAARKNQINRNRLASVYNGFDPVLQQIFANNYTKALRNSANAVNVKPIVNVNGANATVGYMNAGNGKYHKYKRTSATSNNWTREGENVYNRNAAGKYSVAV